MNEPMHIASSDRVAIAWHGLPMYAAACIAAAIRSTGRAIDVIGTRPQVPAVGMDAVIGRPVTWIDNDSRVAFQDLGLDLPRLIFVSGWAVPSFMRLASQVRRAGGRVVCMADNSFRGDARQLAGRVAYRMLYRRFFDHVWVPGHSASRLMRLYGVPADAISQGLYTADTQAFRMTSPIESRPLRFIFVGQFIERKNVLRLCDAFVRFRKASAQQCDLHLYGAGPLQHRIPRHPDIVVHPFASPVELATALNHARCLVLPSIIDHWGLVVHEAASCGTLLIVSDTTGAAADLCVDGNSRVVAASSTEQLVRAFHWAASLPPADLDAASRMSRERAAAFSIEAWVQTFQRICSRLTFNDYLQRNTR